MSPKPLHAGEPAGISHDSQQADSDSAGTRGARAGESGPEQGASLSNTAPCNSNSVVPVSFQLLRRAVDSLYLSFAGDLKPEVFQLLTVLKTKAQSDHLEEQAKAQFELGDHLFEVKDKGAGMFPIVLDDNAYRIQLSRPGKRLPMAYVKVSAEYLAFKGPRDVNAELVRLLNTMGGLSGRTSVSRVDLAVDFTASFAMDSWPRQAWVTRARRIDSHASDQAFTGWSIGMGGVIGARLYDKVREIVHSGKAWALDLWPPGLPPPGQAAWRLEFEFKRDVLKQLKLGSLDSVLRDLSGLWAYASTEWLRLTVPNDADSTRSRWPTHPLWAALAGVDWGGDPERRLERFTNTRAPDERRLYGLVYGSLASYMAIHQIDNRHDAIEGFLGKMHQHFQDLAYRQGLDADQALAHKVAARSRLFNKGRTPNVPTDAGESEGERAYRRASKGE